MILLPELYGGTGAFFPLPLWSQSLWTKKLYFVNLSGNFASLLWISLPLYKISSNCKRCCEWKYLPYTV